MLIERWDAEGSLGYQAMVRMKLDRPSNSRSGAECQYCGDFTSPQMTFVQHTLHKSTIASYRRCPARIEGHTVLRGAARSSTGPMLGPRRHSRILGDPNISTAVHHSGASRKMRVSLS